MEPPRRASLGLGEEVQLHEYEAERVDSDENSLEELGGRMSSNILGGFIMSSRSRRGSVQGVANHRVARVLFHLLRHPVFVNMMGFITLFDAFLTCVDIDERAAREMGEAEATGGHQILSTICLALYTTEFAMWLIVMHWRVFLRRLLVIDFIIICTGYAELVLFAVGLDAVTLVWLRILRIVRILRLLKVFRKLSWLKELRKLVNMTSTCMRTLAWSFIFCFVIMTVWAMLMVEFIHPIILELDRQGEFPDCDFCARAASSVMFANLLLFKTVIAGDSWGHIAVPVIEAYPATAVIFVGSLLTLVFGVLQLIVAVVVDTFAEKRERDVLNRAEEMENDIEEDKRFLQRIFDRVDADGSGELTLSELMEGARKDPEFQSRLRVMDIDQNDLKQLFAMIDVKGTGLIDPEEFIQPLSRWVHESKTANRFVKYNVMRTIQQNDELRAYTHAKFEQLSGQIQRIGLSLGVPMELASGRRKSRRNDDEGRLERANSQAISERSERQERSSERQDRSSERSGSLVSDAPSKSMKSIMRRLSLMEAQQRQILEHLGHLGVEADRRVLAVQGLSSVSLSSVASNPSGGVPGGTAGRAGSEATPPHRGSGGDVATEGRDEGEGVSERDVDVALQRAMQVVEDVLQDAAATACIKAGEALRLRIQSMLAGTGSPPPEPVAKPRASSYTAGLQETNPISLGES